MLCKGKLIDLYDFWLFQLSINRIFVVSIEYKYKLLYNIVITSILNKPKRGTVIFGIYFLGLL